MTYCPHFGSPTSRAQVRSEVGIIFQFDPWLCPEAEALMRTT